jgi:hypothetical protein
MSESTTLVLPFHAGSVWMARFSAEGQCDDGVCQVVILDGIGKVVTTVTVAK